MQCPSKRLLIWKCMSRSIHGTLWKIDSSKKGKIMSRSNLVVSFNLQNQRKCFTVILIAYLDEMRPLRLGLKRIRFGTNRIIVTFLVLECSLNSFHRFVFTWNIPTALALPSPPRGTRSIISVSRNRVKLRSLIANAISRRIFLVWKFDWEETS